MLIPAPAVLREVCIRRLSLFVSGVLIPLACSVENSMLVSGVWSLAPQLRVCAARMRRRQAPYVQREGFREENAETSGTIWHFAVTDRQTDHVWGGRRGPWLILFRPTLVLAVSRAAARLRESLCATTCRSVRSVRRRAYVSR